MVFDIEFHSRIIPFLWGRLLLIIFIADNALVVNCLNELAYDIVHYGIRHHSYN